LNGNLSTIYRVDVNRTDEKEQNVLDTITRFYLLSMRASPYFEI